MSELTHFDEAGRARMVDVGEKDVTHRVAVAGGVVRMEPATLALIREGRAAKGDVLAVAQVAAIMAAKKAHELIPMCHPLLLERRVRFIGPRRLTRSARSTPSMSVHTLRPNVSPLRAKTGRSKRNSQR